MMTAEKIVAARKTASRSLAKFPGTLVLLGAGKMGHAMLEGWLARGLNPRKVVLIEPQPGKAIKALTRRGVLAEVLGALQRMGLNPPPAILVRPEDALASVRSAILLGAVFLGERLATKKA